MLLITNINSIYTTNNVGLQPGTEECDNASIIPTYKFISLILSIATTDIDFINKCCM